MKTSRDIQTHSHHHSPAHAHDEPVTTPPSADDVHRRLAEHGYRLTGPRLAIVHHVLTHTRPFTAEQLVGELSSAKVTPHIGRATVYRTLEVLAAIDVLTRIVQPDGHPTYLCGTPGHRHHLVCERCGSTVTFTACPVDDLIDRLTANTDFLIHDHVLEVFGICPDCQRTAETSA